MASSAVRAAGGEMERNYKKNNSGKTGKRWMAALISKLGLVGTP
jgi:hypothetical protein